VAPSGPVRSERVGSIAIVRLDRPPVNALELDTIIAAEGALDESLSSQPAALVLTGTGECFSAGLDLKIVPLYTPEQQRETIVRANRLLATLYGCPIPVVAAVNGHAIAAGLVLALACDFRVGTRRPSKLGLPEARAGIPFPAAAMTIVRAELAPTPARVLTLGAQNIDPERALAVGVLDELEAAKRVLPRALEVARELATIPRGAYAAVKGQLRAETMGRLRGIVDGVADPLLASWLGHETATASRTLVRKKGGA
jgi:enoyl-CoA hydratase